MFQGCVFVLLSLAVSTTGQIVNIGKERPPCEIKSAPQARGSVKDPAIKWPKNNEGFVQVPYVIDSGLTEEAKNKVLIAIQQYDWYTCLSVRPKQDDDVNYITFVNSTGCASYIGMQGGSQDVELSSDCDLGATVHEILHAVGFAHEQSRPDRNENVDVFFENIIEEKKFNFEIDSNIDSLGTAYDVESIMHYSSHAFSSNDNATLLQKDGSEIPISYNGFSTIDIEQLNLYYECGGVNKALDDEPTECYYKEDRGLSYRGTLSVNSLGNDCYTWSEVFTFYESIRFHLSGLEENYCRNYYPEKFDSPVCYDINHRDFIACNISQCSLTTTQAQVSTLQSTAAVPQSTTDMAPKSTTTVPQSTTDMAPKSTTTVPQSTTDMVAESTTTVPQSTSDMAPESTTTMPQSTTDMAFGSTTTVPQSTTDMVAESTTTVPQSTTDMFPESTTTMPQSSTNIFPESTATVAQSTTDMNSESTAATLQLTTTVEQETTPAVPTSTTSNIDWINVLANAFNHFFSHKPMPGNLHPECLSDVGDQAKNDL